MWGQLPQLSASPDVWNRCFRAVSLPDWHTLTDLHWSPVLLVPCFCFLLCSGVICPVSHGADSQLVPGPHEWWKVIFLKGLCLPTQSWCSAGRSQEIWCLKLFKVHLGCLSCLLSLTLGGWHRTSSQHTRAMVLVHWELQSLLQPECGCRQS